jgi:uncharacterized repeat protein (TIGR01451 family)
MLQQTAKKSALWASAVCMFFSPVVGHAQDNFVGDQQPVNRVIRLQPQTGSKAKDTNPTTVSRVQRNEFQATASGQAPNVGYDKIRVPKVLQSTQAAPPAPQKLPSARAAELPSKAPTNVSKPIAAKPAAARKSTTSKSLISSLDSSIRTTIESPRFVNVNKTAVVTARLANTGKTEVGQVEFLVALPSHARLVSATPKPAAIDGQIVRFNLSGMNANEKQLVRMNVVSSKRGQIDIATSVRTESQQKVLVAVREPQLQAILNGPQQANIGDKVMHELVITNTGDGVATDVNVQTLFPTSLVQMKSQSGVIAAIAPGKSEKVVFHSQAVAAGPVQLKASVRSDDGTAPKLAQLDVMVFEPTLQVSAIGPKVNFVNRNGIYTINLENQGKVDVTEVQVALTVPKGMKVTTISREANVDAKKGVLSWRFDKIAKGTSEQIQLMAVAAEEGEQISTIIVDSHETAEKQIQLATRVTTRASVSVAVKNESGPVQVGGKALFAVELANNGSRQAIDVNVTVELPESLRAVESDSQKLSQVGNKITFTEPQIGPGSKVAFKFAAVGVNSGEHVVRTVTQVEGSERRVVAEDSVFVYEIDEARVSESLKPELPKR